jgi:hypothetical protein
LAEEFALGAEGTELRPAVASLATLLGWAVGTAMWPLTAVAEISKDSLLGLGLPSRPTYGGSASQRLEVVPVIRCLGQPWSIRSTQGLMKGGVRPEARWPNVRRAAI